MKRTMLRKGSLIFAVAVVAATGAMLVACAQKSPGDNASQSGGDTPVAPAPPLAGADSVTTVASAQLPAKPAADDYDAQDKLFGENQLDQAFLDEMAAFSYRSASAVLADDAQKNSNFAPISLYYALAMTQQGAAGTTRDELSAALGSQDASATAQQCGNLLRLLATDQLSDVRLANSAWMRPDITFKQGFVDIMSSQFYAALFLADFGTPEADAAMGKWIADNTEGTLNPQFHSDPAQLLSLINTVYFKSAWTDAFDAEDTQPDAFTTADGGEMQASFMSQRLEKPQEVRVTSDYTRASLNFADGSQMTFVLPAEGVSAQSLLQDPAALKEAFSGESTGEAFVTYRVPKFGFDSSFDLIPPLQALGVKAAFGDTADFSNLTETPAYVSSVVQESHIGLDENGVEASAYTKVDIMEMSALPDPEIIDEMELNLNRPFLYQITSRQGAPLFIGVCAQPS